jgi:hypothetical protein
MYHEMRVMTVHEQELLATKLESDLLHLYGTPVLTGEPLQKAMGYRTIYALRQAISRKTFPVKLFTLPNRRGKYALVKDVALYLAEHSTNLKE